MDSRLVSMALTLMVLEVARATEKGATLDECYQAVSYIHLRAHETVLDLVCRLLLEKKKTKTKNKEQKMEKEKPKQIDIKHTDTKNQSEIKL